MKYYLFLSFCFIALLTGCAKSKSEDIRTTGLYVQYHATAAENRGSVSASVTIQVGGPTGTYVDLSGSDKIFCNGQEMDRSNLFNMITYTKTLPYQSHGLYEFVLKREGEADKTARVTLPDVVDISQPQNMEASRIGDPLFVRWNRGSDKTVIDLTKSNDGGADFHSTQDPDIGELTIPGSQTLAKTPGLATLRVSRIRAGEFPAGFTGGHIHGKESRSISVNLVP